ncbi:hypothetical protein [Pedobacter nyackensis]|uniref:PBCV-specific basic adaptor domain-containing protein n=1 Tax=Pedobacter nyackensis TaxID=475255 RepID=A0A1W2B0Q4_9SPHI|nr:hypothetical protein [Pedobacter nyackensis]SMC66516.1 hypothetical protein SAMN04488101_10230 [Pedobacter nyackensis]
MKKKYLLGMLTLAMCSASIFSVSAQDKKKETGVGKAIDKTGKTIGKTATKVGNKTAEVAVKGTAKVADQVYKGKMAPDGSNVYIDGKNRKYYINKKGGKVYLKASEIKTRPVKKSN